MTDLKSLDAKIREIYPDLTRFGIFTGVRKDRLIGGDAYILTLEKDTRTTSFELSRQDMDACMRGDQCSLITLELGRFIRQFIDETYAVPEAG